MIGEISKTFSNIKVGDSVFVYVEPRTTLNNPTLRKSVVTRVLKTCFELDDDSFKWKFNGRPVAKMGFDNWRFQYPIVLHPTSDLEEEFSLQKGNAVNKKVFCEMCCNSSRDFPSLKP